MESKLINVYAYLRETRPDLDILHAEPPTYIRTLTGNNNKILFIHKFVNKSDVIRDRSPVFHVKPENGTPVKSSNISGDESEILGSPLKDDCNVEELCVSPVNIHSFNAWTENEENYMGLPYNEALELVNELHEKNPAPNDNGSVWVLVQGDDPGCTFLIEIEVEKGTFTRGTVLFLGIRTSKEIETNHFITENKQLCRSSIKREIQVDTSYTFYNNTTLSFRETGENELKNSDFMHKNEFTLHQIFNLKDVTRDTRDFLNQIFMLNELFNVIVQFKEDFGDKEHSEPEYRRSGGIDMDIVRSRILKILTAFPEPHTKVDIDRKSLLETALDKAKERQLDDSTDQLWEILKYCGSMRDLKNALQLIFQTSVKCNIVNMPSANTKLGELIRDLAEKRHAFPVLTGSEPLELLLEIGLEKTMRDYNFIFEESRICSANDLKIIKKENSKTNEAINVRKSLYNAVKATETDEKQRKTLLHVNSDDHSTLSNETFVGFQNTRFNESEIEQKLSRLLQIHLILEHLLLVQVNLGTSNIFQAITRKMLNEQPTKFKKVLKDGVSKLEVTVFDDKLNDLIENKAPSAKRISIVSENKFKKLQTVHYFTMNHIFPPNLYEKVFKPCEELKLDDKKENYWTFSYFKVMSKR